MRRTRARLALAFVITVFVTLLGAPAHGDFGGGCIDNGVNGEPAAGKRLSIIGQTDLGVNEYVAGTGIVPGGTTVYTSIHDVSSLTTPVGGPTSYQDAQQMLNRYPDSALHLSVSFWGPLLGDINGGVYDANIVALANFMKADNADRPIYLRLGYEFDNSHTGWQYDPTAYVAAFQRVVDRLRAEGVGNASYVWSSWAAPTYNNYPISAWYPGDGYVDVVGVSIFGQAYSNNPGGFVYADAVDAFADLHAKPMMVAESFPQGSNTSTQNGSTLWNSWYKPLINWMDAHNIKIWHYIDDNWGGSWGDGRVQVNPILESKFVAEVTKSKYINASPGMYCASLGYKRDNLARTATRVASSTDEWPQYGFTLPNVNDGHRDAAYGPIAWGSVWHADPVGTEYMCLDLGGATTVQRVDLYARADVTYAGQGFPVDFTIGVSNASCTAGFTTVITRTNYPQPAGGAVQSFTFGAQSARYVRVHATKLGYVTGYGYYMQLGEMEVY